MDSKSVLRTKAKDIRKTLDISNISKNIVNKIRNLDCYKSAKNIMIFYPMKYEINLLDLLNDDKSFYLPKVEGKDLLVCPYSKNLKKSEFNVFEPDTEPVNPKTLDLIIVPALMVDKNGYRLGYGGGFYDRFLSKYPDIKTIVPIAKELVFDDISRDNWDIKIKYIITQS